MVVGLVDAAVFAVIDAELFEPLGEVRKDLEATGSHAVENAQHARFHSVGAVGKLGALGEHRHALRPIELAGTRAFCARAGAVVLPRRGRGAAAAAESSERGMSA